jgi:hypothetical protein
VALAPVVREFLPLLDKAGQEVRAIVLVPTLSGSDGQPLAGELEQLGGSSALIVRLAHRIGSTLRQPDDVAGTLAENLLCVYCNAAAARAAAAAQQAAMPKARCRNGLAAVPAPRRANEASLRAVTAHIAGGHSGDAEISLTAGALIVTACCQHRPLRWSRRRSPTGHQAIALRRAGATN